MKINRPLTVAHVALIHLEAVIGSFVVAANRYKPLGEELLTMKGFYRLLSLQDFVG
jgi:hypothetical protein